MNQLLVLRFSAMGDVALLTPVIRAFSHQYPNRQITIVTRQKFSVFFDGFPNVQVFGADFEGRHKGLKGLYQLFRDLQKRGRIEYVIDAHQNLRSAVLKQLFFMAGIPSATLDKGRADKKALTRQDSKLMIQLPHSIERYQTTFAKAGFPVTLEEAPYFVVHSHLEQEVLAFLQQHILGNSSRITENEEWIGIAPFAQHTEKMWPFERFESVLSLLSETCNARIFLFGGGPEELAKLESLTQKFPQCTLVSGKLSLAQELTLIHHLDLMICMDSGNMHLAALSGVPVLSIWGATHPYAGFGPYGQSEKNVLQIPTEELSCRPCSVFGNKPCWRGDLACMTRITPEMVVERTLELLHGSHS